MDLFIIHYNDDTQIVICLNTVTAFHQIICLPPLGVTISRTSDPFKAERLDLILQESEPRLPTRPGPNWNPEVFGDGSRVWDQRWDRHWDSAGGRSYSGPRAKDEGLEIFSKVLKWWRNTAVFLTLAGNENIHTSYFLSGRVYRRSTRLLLLSWMHSAAFIQRGIKCQKQTLPCKLIKNVSKSLGWLWRGGVFCSITSVLQMWISCW